MPLWIQKCRCFIHFITNQLMPCYVEWLPWVSPPQYGTQHLFTFSYQQPQSILRQGRISTRCLWIKASPQRWRGPQGTSASWAAHYTNFPLPSPAFSALLLPTSTWQKIQRVAVKSAQAASAASATAQGLGIHGLFLLNPHWRGKNNFSA